MKFIYTSHWKSSDANTFKLCGVLVAGSDGVMPYFPEDADEREEWSEQISRVMDTGKSFSPMVWLRQIADSGNGITEEFGTIREIEARSPDEASEKAFTQVLQEYGRNIRLYQEAVPGEPAKVSDPLAGILAAPLSVPKPTRQSRRPDA